MFKLAMVQMHVEGGNKATNLSRAEKFINEAEAAGANMVLLPEAMDLGWTHPAAAAEAESIPDGESCQMLIEAATGNGMFVCSGLVEKCGDRIYNAAVIIDPNGKVVAHHRKLNELEIGHDYYGQGSSLSVCETDLGNLGLMICADAFVPGHVISRSLGYMGADIILSPCSWAMPASHDNDKAPYGDTWRNAYIPVAKAFSMWIVGVSNVGWITAGPWKGMKCIGNSLAVDPSGWEVMWGSYGVEAEEVLYLDVALDERPARGCGWNTLWEKNKGKG